MRKLIAITQLTVDGVMQAPGGPEEDTRGEFTHGGWFMRFGDEVLGSVLDETIAGEFAMLLGRRTYDTFAGYWPHQDNAIGKAFNRAKKYVVTRKHDRLEWQGAERIGGEAVVDGVRRLKAAAGPEVHVWGSGELLQTLMAADLIDEHRLWIAPVVLGTGRRLFERGVPPRTLKLVETRSTTTGILLNTYRPAER